MRTIQIGSALTHQLAPLFRRVSRRHNEALAPFELRAVEGHILAALMEQGPMTVRQVQQVLGLRGSTLTGALDRLERRELLRREPTPGDRRSFMLVPAKLNARKRERLSQALEAAEAACYAGLSAAERKQLFRLLTKANAHLQAEES